MVGSLYSAEDSRRDAGFSLYYLGVNLGAFVAPLVTGFLAQGRQWKDRLAALGFDPLRKLALGICRRGSGDDAGFDRLSFPRWGDRARGARRRPIGGGRGENWPG